jgi:hypothetical protein
VCTEGYCDERVAAKPINALVEFAANHDTHHSHPLPNCGGPWILPHWVRQNDSWANDGVSSPMILPSMVLPARANAAP